ncbi:MAG: hypothetical protein KFF72_15040 [Arthrospira sp. SH-MAG29]|nr:hypothetical protein [Arthrospira sp. SH-MAG29]MBS0017638.1 hypothetical protein [Arthrospira sp. SH-MAG29]
MRQKKTDNLPAFDSMAGFLVANSLGKISVAPLKCRREAKGRSLCQICYS